MISAKGSVAASELAKLGKCDLLIKPTIKRSQNSDDTRKSQENNNTRSGKVLHDEFEADAKYYMDKGFESKSRKGLLLWIVIIVIIGTAVIDFIRS